jgi:hypothetical protein
VLGSAEGALRRPRVACIGFMPERSVVGPARAIGSRVPFLIDVV